MPPTILKSYGWAAGTFAASDKGWHKLFADTPHGPRFLHPKELAVAQGFLWGFTLPNCRTQAWQLLGNSVPPPWRTLGWSGQPRPSVAQSAGCRAATGRRKVSTGVAEPVTGPGHPVAILWAGVAPPTARGGRGPPPASGVGPGGRRNFRRQTAQVAVTPGGHDTGQARL